MIDPNAQRAPATQRLVAGIDGGQSSTTAIIMNDHGDVLGRGVAGPCDHVDEPVDSRRCADACETAVTRALDAAGLPKTAALATVVVGLSGYDGSFHGVAPRFGGAAVRFLHDAPVALAGAVDRRPAVVVIAGTGSVAYAEDGTGRNVRVGGYGYLFGDVGSSFWLARAALSTAMDDADRGTPTRLGDAALAYFDRTDLRALARAFYVREIGRPEVAAFAPRRVRCRAAGAIRRPMPSSTKRRKRSRRSPSRRSSGSKRRSRRSPSRSPAARSPTPTCTGAPGSRSRPAPSAARIVKPLHEPAIGAARLALELD